MSNKPVCSKCGGQHHPEQDCVLHWRGEWSLVMRKLEACQNNYSELKQIYKELKSKEVPVH